LRKVVGLRLPALYCEKFEVEDYKCMTIHKCLGLDINENETDKKCINFSNYDVIVIDELFRIDPWLMSKLYFELKKVSCKIILIGHSSQIKYISKENYRYDKCD